jgi:bifunctional ADP-heptose synthase (sugar kinase/adenylyltransferase)
MKKILVIGDSCKDVFVYCHAQRLAPDLPIPILDVIEETENPGMAANVARNIKAVYEESDLITNEGWELVTKTRYMHGKTNHAFIRIDSKHPVLHGDVSSIPLSDYDIIAISDYHKGFLTEADIQYICENHACVFMDTKKQLGAWANEGENGAFHRGTHYPVSEKVEVKDTSGAGDSFYAALIVNYAETGDIGKAIDFANECARRAVEQRGVSLIERP